MKKKFTKKLIFKKETVTNLQVEEMRQAKGASLIVTSCGCDTASCSIFVHCCDPTITEENLKIYRDLG